MEKFIEEIIEEKIREKCLVDSSIKIITSGNIPTTDKLSEGELAYGTINGEVRYFFNPTGQEIIELIPKTINN
ncbi:MAG: hypothetical protein LBC47_06015 [Tannerella sp.]|jgi:hypothetical protein|nr:hypothetical protein [Tannerella sp.]